MMRTTTLLAYVLLSFSACAGPQPDPPGSALPATEARAIEPLGVFAGLLKVSALPSLPTPTRARNPYASGSGFHLGVFSNPAQWKACVAAAGQDPFGTAEFHIDWTTHMIAFAVLDAQTNRLSFEKWRVDDKGSATMLLKWNLIEPHYHDSTPAVFVVVPRASEIHFTADTHGSLGVMTTGL